MNTAKVLRPKPPARAQQALSEEDLKGLLWPIVKRLPAYFRLAWALAREPAIERKHKALLYSAVVYTVTPVQFLVSPIPVLGQIDTIILLLLGIRQAAAHCPPESLARHLARLHLKRKQLNQDLYVTLYVSWRVMGKMSRPAKRQLRFAGRVATGFGRRLLGRITKPKPKSHPQISQIDTD